MGRGILLLDISPPLLSPSSISSSSSSSLSSLTVMIIVLSSALILSFSLYILLRLLSLHHSTTTTTATADPHKNFRQSINSASSLPLFEFRSLATNNNADCAICLASFESADQLRLLPLCCHAFHADCIDTWLSSSHDTCPLCRTTVSPTEEADAPDKTLTRANSYRIELGSVSRRNNVPEGLERSYSIGPYEYVVGDQSYEVAVGNKEAGLGGGGDVVGRSWLRTFSRRGSGGFWNGRRSESVVMREDLEVYRIGEEISEIFRWLSGV